MTEQHSPRSDGFKIVGTIKTKAFLQEEPKYRLKEGLQGIDPHSYIPEKYFFD
jgi:hypothetical protein